MSRRRSRTARFPWSSRQHALFLLLAWSASLLLPAFHLEPEGDGHTDGHHACSGLFEHSSAGASLDADCAAGEGCANPWHHHHSDSHHDASQCPVCSSLLERVETVAVRFDDAPVRVASIARPAPRLPRPSERFAIALARGPPRAPAAFVEGAHGV